MHVTHSSPTGIGGPQIEVVSWPDLAQLPEVLDELTRQVAEIVEHAERWVCSTAGFEPSPVCVLRPLVPVLERVAHAFGEVGTTLARELAELGTGVEASYVELLGADGAARRSCHRAA